MSKTKNKDKATASSDKNSKKASDKSSKKEKPPVADPAEVTPKKEKAQKIKKEENAPVEVTSDNLEEVSKTAPTAEQAKIAKENKKSAVEKVSAQPEAVHTNPLLVYSDSIRNTIRNHFRMMSRQEINELMARGNYPFSYEVKPNPAQPGNQIFIDIADAQNKARIPNDENDFITING